MKRTYKFRIYLKKGQSDNLGRQLRLCKDLYNVALDQRRNSWEFGKESVLYRSQADELSDIKSRHPEFKDVHSQALQDVLRRLDKAFKSFFRRVKEKKKGKKAKIGYPRFKSIHGFRSITYPQSGFKLLDNGHIWVSKIGTIRMFRHRPIKGTVKTMTLKKDKVGDWFVTFSVVCPDVKVKETDDPVAIGIDVGLEKLATVSDGDIVEAPRFLRRSEERLKIAQRRLSRKRKGSRKRNKARIKVARIQRKIARQRDDLLHKEARKIVDKGDIIAFESLNINGMVKNPHLSKSIMDASWGRLVQYTAYKAESAGKQIVLVDPKGTSQDCSRCGATVRKSLSDRVHVCPTCGLSIDRDLNASLNIMKRIHTGSVELLKNASGVRTSIALHKESGKYG